MKHRGGLGPVQEKLSSDFKLKKIQNVEEKAADPLLLDQI